MDTPVTMNLTEDDVVAANRLYVRSHFRDPANWRQLFWLWLAMQGVLIAIYTFSPRNSKGLFSFLAIMELGFIVAIFVVPVLMSTLLGPRQARRHFNAMKILQGPIELVWSTDGLQEKTNSSVALTPWHHFAKWHEDDRSFILFVAPTMYRLVPKRFMTVQQIDDLRARLNQEVGTK
jgi:YcxB-like protein